MPTILQLHVLRRSRARNRFRRSICGGLAVLVGATSVTDVASGDTGQNGRLQSNPYAVGSQDFGPPSTVDWRPVAVARLQMPRVWNPNATVSNLVPSDLNQGDFQHKSSERNAERQATVTMSASASSSAATLENYEPLPAKESEPASRPARLPVTGVIQTTENLPEAENLFGRPGGASSQLASAAKKRSAYIEQQEVAPRAGASVYLATQTAQSQLEIAAELFQQAQLDFDYRAYSSSETSAWQSLEKSAEAIDLAVSANGNSDPSKSPEALRKLHRGKRALIEACDFVGPFAQNDAASIARLARAHETPVVRESLPPMRASYGVGQQSTSTGTVKEPLPSASEAIDRYLDYARAQFSELASRSLMAAQTMDLLAAIRLGRNELTQLPGPTAICLRRAAVQGQSNNADLVAKLGHHLADVGLIDEARWALGHSLALQPNQANATRLAQLNSVQVRATPKRYGDSIMVSPQPKVKREPEVISLSPSQFAAISASVMPGKRPSSHDQTEMMSKSMALNAKPHDGLPTNFANATNHHASARARPAAAAVVTNETPRTSTPFLQGLAASFRRKPKTVAPVQSRSARNAIGYGYSALPRQGFPNSGTAMNSNAASYQAPASGHVVTNHSQMTNTVPSFSSSIRRVTSSQNTATRHTSTSNGNTALIPGTARMPGARVTYEGAQSFTASSQPIPPRVSSTNLPAKKRWW